MVMMSGQAHIEMAVKATRLGALDFLEKPISTDKLLLAVQNAMKLERLKRKIVNSGSDWAATEWFFRREDEQADGASGARRRERDTRLYSGRDGNGQGTDGADDAREKPPAGWSLRDVELRGGSGGVD